VGIRGNTLSRKLRLTKRILRFAWRIVGGGHWDWSHPCDYVYEITTEKVHEYIGVPLDGIKSWCIVGGYLGSEVPQILRKYPNVRVDIFECSPRYLPELTKKFETEPRVKVIGRAVSKDPGEATFYETSLVGTGSLLKVGALGAELFGLENAESYQVEVCSIDSHYLGQSSSIDLLQIDVQGAEMQVLEGAKKMLSRTRAVFLEVSIKPDLYSNSTTWAELSAFFSSQGFNPQLLGNDTNGTGNALFVRA
jgi:FkbM family methyltransferase